VVNPRGECGEDQPLSGFYFREARHLRTFRLEVNGRRPWLCEATNVAPDRLLLTYVDPEIRQPGGGGTGQSSDEEETDEHGIPVRALDVQVTFAVCIAGLSVTSEMTTVLYPKYP
jgi:hypothetical protein